MADKLQLLLEAEKRGLLPPDKLALLNEAKKRGLVDDGTVHDDDLKAMLSPDTSATVSPSDTGTKTTGTTTDDKGNIVPVNPMAQDPAAPKQVKSTAADAAPAAPDDGADWSKPTLVPFQHNRRTGAWRPTVPGIVSDTVDAVTLPGDVLAGKYNDQLDPRTGSKTLGNELVGRTLGTAGTMLGEPAFPKVTPAPLKALGSEAAGDFGIPLTKGQASGDLSQLTKEEAIRQGTGGTSNIVRNFDTQQTQAIESAARGIGGKLGDNAESMPDLVTKAIQDKVAFHKDQAAALYSIASDGAVSVKPEMVAALPQVVSHSLENAAVTVDQSLTPGAAAAMRILDDASKMEGGLSPVAGKGAGGFPAGGENPGVTLEGLEQVRKKLVNLGDGANDTDSRALKAIKGAFDDWTQSAVDNMLVSGDDAALEALKQARGASREYLKITSPHEGDAAGAAVKKMQKGDATSEEVANWLYGANVAAPTLNAPKVAARVKTIVGEDSDAWKAVRADVWNRLTQDPKSAEGDMRSNAAIAKRIDTFLNDKGSTLAKTLYSDAERAEMQKFSNALKLTITPRDATNPSRSGWTVMGAMNGVTRLLTGGAVASVAGPQAGAAAYFAIPVFKNIGARRTALDATGQATKAAMSPTRSLGTTRSDLVYLGSGGEANDNVLSPATKVPPRAAPPKVMTLNEWERSGRPVGVQLGA